VCTENGAYEADLVINAAGLDAADVARRAGFEYKQVYYRGEYYEVNRETSKLELNGLVYPVHRPGKPGLGVHLTATVTGRILIGPNARAVPGPEWAERDKTPAEEFHKEAVQFMPDLKLEHISWAYAGIRPKLRSEPGEQDFMVRVEPGKSFVNLIGIESPGLTASLALAEHVHRELGMVA
jgi:L-2-hydroxyglutarate oxidase LhgO